MANPRLSVEDYLESELAATTRHEYLGGVVYARSGASNLHNLVAGNLFAIAFNQLRGGRCCPYNSDTKIRIRMAHQVRFYYPDVSIICRSNPPTDTFQDEPVMIVEVLSPSTRRIDDGEKKEAYLSIPSLNAYLMVDTDSPRVVLFQRTPQGFQRSVWEGLQQVLHLTDPELKVPLGEVYEGVEFAPQA